MMIMRLMRAISQQEMKTWQVQDKLARKPAHWQLSVETVPNILQCSVAATCLTCEVDGVFHSDFDAKFIIEYDNERILKMGQLLTNLRKEVALGLIHNRKWPGFLRQWIDLGLPRFSTCLAVKSLSICKQIHGDFLHTMKFKPILL